MKQTIFACHSVTDKMAKKPCLGLISCKACHYITQIIKLILYFSVASKFVKTKYKEIFHCFIQKNCQLRSLSPQYLNMSKLQFLHQHVKNQLRNFNSLKRSHFCTDYSQFLRIGFICKMIYLERRKKVRLTSEIWAVGLSAGLYYLQVPYTLTNILTNIKNEFESNQQNQIRIQFGSASSNETGSGNDPNRKKIVRSGHRRSQDF